MRTAQPDQVAESLTPLPRTWHIRVPESLCPRLRPGARLPYQRPLSAGVAAPLLRRTAGGTAQCGAAGSGGLWMGAPAVGGDPGSVARAGRRVGPPVGPEPQPPRP